VAIPRVIKVFIASPGDLAVERRAFKDTVDELNKGFGRGADVIFEPLGWEDALSQVGRRSQSVINQDVDACDVFVLVMWRRWGQEAPDAAPYTSYTEEEFYRALARFEKTSAPTIFVLLKSIDPGQMADPGEQLKKVLELRKKLEQTRKVLYRGFEDETAFSREIDQHLIAFARGECKTTEANRAVPIVPESLQAEIDKHKAAAQRAVEELEQSRAAAERAVKEAEKARTEAKDAIARADAAEDVAEAKAARKLLELAESAARAALEGKIEEARQSFAKALDGTTNLRVLYLGYDFFERIGELDEAEQLLRRWLAISGPDARTQETAAAYGNLGVVLRTRGELNGAEAMHRKALEIDEQLGWPEGVANNLGNLANVLLTRGDLDGAEAMHRKALAINEKLGLPDGVANNYANLGVILRTRGDLDGAEAMHRKALAIEVKIGRLEGQATAYGNLGSVVKARGDVQGAREIWTKSRDLFGRIGAQHKRKMVQGWIDGLGP